MRGGLLEQPMKSSPKERLPARAWRLLLRTIQAWQNDNATHLAAALSFYTVFSMAPLLILLVAVIGSMFGRQAAREEVVYYLTNVAGPQVAGLAQSLIAAAARRKSLATFIGTATMLGGATVVFAELQTALNLVWGVKTKPGRLVWRWVRKRLLSFLIILVVGAVLLASLIGSTALSGVKQQVESLFLAKWWFILASIVASFAITWLVFSLIFHYLPDVVTEWRYDVLGAGVTALLFSTGKELISLYLGRSTTASPYGAAGSLFAFLLWLYYSAQIFFLGAEFTKIYTMDRGGRVIANADAVRVTKTVVDEVTGGEGEEDTTP
jgi:membrane protein